FLRNNDKNGQFRDVLEGINLIAAVHAQRAPSEKKKRHVRPKRSGDFQHLLGGQLLFCELQVGEHRGYGIARAPAQPPARGNPLSQQKRDRKSTRLNSSHVAISYAVFCLKKKQNRSEFVNVYKNSS